MARKDITDLQVLKAYQESKRINMDKWPYEILMEWTGEPEKVCYRAMERAENRGLIDCGITLRSGWITDKGKELLEDELNHLAAVNVEKGLELVIPGHRVKIQEPTEEEVVEIDIGRPVGRPPKCKQCKAKVPSIVVDKWGGTARYALYCDDCSGVMEAAGRMFMAHGKLRDLK